jgi:hypothetical protein
MPFFAASEALRRLESMKFPVFSLLAGNLGIFRDEFAADSPLHRRVYCEPYIVDRANTGLHILRLTGEARGSSKTRIKRGAILDEWLALFQDLPARARPRRSCGRWP